MKQGESDAFKICFCVYWGLYQRFLVNYYQNLNHILRSFFLICLQNSWRCNTKSETQHLLQTEHLRLLVLRRSKRDCHRRELLSLCGLFGPANGHLQWPRLPHEMHRILEGKSQILLGYFWWIRSIFKIQVCNWYDL